MCVCVRARNAKESEGDESQKGQRSHDVPLGRQVPPYLQKAAAAKRLKGKQFDMGLDSDDEDSDAEDDPAPPPPKRRLLPKPQGLSLPRPQGSA